MTHTKCLEYAMYLVRSQQVCLLLLFLYDPYLVKELLTSIHPHSCLGFLGQMGASMRWLMGRRTPSRSDRSSHAAERSRGNPAHSNASFLVCVPLQGQTGALLISVNNAQLPQWRLGTPGRQESDAMLMAWGGVCLPAPGKAGGII